jgi:hypothetical protein
MASQCTSTRQCPECRHSLRWSLNRLTQPKPGEPSLTVSIARCGRHVKNPEFLPGCTRRALENPQPDRLSCWCLTSERPIGGRKSDVPKARCRPLELDSNLCRTSQLLLREYYAALLLFPAERVLQNKPLVRDDLGCQADQCAMCIDYQSMCPFIEG